MGEVTHISWADHTFNPWVGCMKVGPACDGCYAENLMDTRFGRVQWGAPGAGVGTRERTSAGNWSKPRAWDRKAKADGTRPFVFCASLADVFDNAVPNKWREDLFDLIHMTPHLTWLLLTKRPGNILTAWGNAMREGREWPSNAAIGCTVVNQDEADRDVPILLEAKAKLSPAFAFLSMEPLLGPVDLTALNETDGVGSYRWSALELGAGPWRRLDWVITGGETDQGTHMARPQHPDWFRSLRDQCAAAGVAFHHKQNGEWVSGHAPTHWVGIAGGVREVGEGVWATDAGVAKVGQGAAGRMLDGVIHDARPVVV